MRTLRSQPPSKPRRRQSEPEGVQVTCADVMWWAKTNNREPFNSAANAIRSAGSRAKHVIWTDTNTMEVVVA